MPARNIRQTELYLCDQKACVSNRASLLSFFEGKVAFPPRLNQGGYRLEDTAWPFPVETGGKQPRSSRVRFASLTQLAIIGAHSPPLFCTPESQAFSLRLTSGFSVRLGSAQLTSLIRDNIRSQDQTVGQIGPPLVAYTRTSTSSSPQLPIIPTAIPMFPLSDFEGSSSCTETGYRNGREERLGRNSVGATTSSQGSSCSSNRNR